MSLMRSILCAVSIPLYRFSVFFFFNDTATTEIYTLSLHDALPISGAGALLGGEEPGGPDVQRRRLRRVDGAVHRSEEHTSELQSQSNLVCRLLLEKKKKQHTHSAVQLYHLLPTLAALLTNTVLQHV